jgi:response regulator RpfG family c-di-GMP phosphodiesterase
MNHHPHIMVVCDTAGDKDVLQDVLADLAEVSFGNSGEHGIRNVQAWQPELVVVAATLADMDGAQVLAVLKKDPRTTGIPVLLMADRSDADAESRFLLQGATDVLHTPLRAEAVRSRIQLHLKLARRVRQLHAFEHLQRTSELLDDLLATARLAAGQAADGRPVEQHVARLLETGQQLKRSLAPGGDAGAEPLTQPHAAAAAPRSSATEPAKPPPATPPAGATGEDHFWLPIDPQEPPAR